MKMAGTCTEFSKKKKNFTDLTFYIFVDYLRGVI